VRELAKRMAQVEERLRKIALEQRQKAEELRRARMRQAKRFRDAAAKYEIDRTRKAQEALMKADLRTQRIAAEKKAALELRERERTERYRGPKARPAGKGKKK
jgi:hypothetical protein